MTLGQLVVAWLAVAAWMIVTTVVALRLVAAMMTPPGQAGMGAMVPKTLVWWRVIEALLLTLLGGLWFGSLGSGGWWLPFLLVGVLAIGPRWLSALDRSGVVAALVDLARYVVSGAILAWILR